MILQMWPGCATCEPHAPSLKGPMRIRAMGSSRWGGRSFTVRHCCIARPRPAALHYASDSFAGGYLEGVLM